MADELAPGVTDLLGAIAYGELAGFDRLAEDAREAPSLRERVALSEMAAAEMGHYTLLRNYLAERGVDVADAMAPFGAALDGWHASTAPKSWTESLVKVYLGEGLTADFYREIATWVDEQTRQVVLEVLADTGHAEFAEREIAAACAREPGLRDKLALWGRRLLGEALTQSQYVVAERDSLAELIIKGSGDLAGIGALFRKVQKGHAKRMQKLGLS
ncbi:ferritin-like fold-containing protein [Sciscionella sediminilitoris]|uniref:ferritin-like fold-containing protein n=1 Tax=Sciscionella sediminilitoris TaxID=1445613 RepID=UPI0004DF18F3|nr:ferritin-like fold-containing protein [Sciscionella sp. SE31]